MTDSPSPQFGAFVDVFERVLVPAIFRPWGEDLVDRVPPRPSDRVLDVACGTGIVARIVRERLGASSPIIGVDLQPGMIQLARAVAPDIDWREANALELPFESGSFDRVYCQQGLQFFPDRAAAVREMRRVLDQGGTVAISTWRQLEEQPFLEALHRAASRHVEVPPDRRLSLGDRDELGALLEGAGFRDIEVETAARTERYADPALIVRLHCMAIIPSLGPMDNVERDRTIAVILADMADTIARFADDGRSVVYESRANVAVARA